MEFTTTISDSYPTALFSNATLSPELTACVVVPVKDEEIYITQTLTALANQVDLQGRPLNRNTFEILVLANNCTDRSVEYIQNFTNHHPSLRISVEEVTLPPQQANIGYVRRLLMDAAYKRLSGNKGGLILTTDGDTQVAPDWIAQTQWEIEEGADAVGGRILLDPAEIELLDATTFRQHLQDEKYQLLIAELEATVLQPSHNPLPTHHQHFNGSFAVTTTAYAKAGGVPDVTHLEDCAFYERLQQIDAKVRHSPQVVVHTSARYAGRAEIGLSNQLAQWRNAAQAGKYLLVESGEAIFQRLQTQKGLLDLWKRRKSSDLNVCNALRSCSNLIEIDAAACEAFRKSFFFGAWYAETIKPQEALWRIRYPDVPVEEAILQLQAALSAYTEPAFSQTSIR